PASVSRNDGLELRDAYVAAAARCAPPDNRPTPEEFDRCRHFLEEEIVALRKLSAFLALGALAWEASLKALATLGHSVARPRPAFSHGARVAVGPYALFGSYHVSQQNTNTGKLTPEMFDRVLLDVRASLSRTGA
ncbi:MAG TPA: uracil-DNA glycosylase family protein, partial [Thermoanaerobaculia bacterium]|nr:uracil-DNA glycosylase family protein [Thermoanaerobaculia bacterium]